MIRASIPDDWVYALHRLGLVRTVILRLIGHLPASRQIAPLWAVAIVQGRGRSREQKLALIERIVAADESVRVALQTTAELSPAAACRMAFDMFEEEASS